MHFLYDFIPIIIFFTIYKIAGIYIATASAILISFLQVSYLWLHSHKIDKLQIITFLLILILGGATLLFHNPIFIKWKPTVIYWIFGIVFLGSQFIGEKPVIFHMMSKHVQLPNVIWKRLNMSWGIFFIIIGTANIYVAYNFNTNSWVNFKLFGVLGLTIIFAILQSWFLIKYMNYSAK